MQAFFDDLKLALRTFVQNPVRSLLTLIGIVIGVATVIFMMGLLEGLQEKVTRDLSSLGADAFSISKWPSGFGRMNWARYARRPNMTLADRDALGEGCPSVSVVSAFDDEGGQTISTSHAKTTPSVMVLGATSEYLVTSGLGLASGRFLTLEDEASAREIAVIGLDVADVLFPGMDPLGQDVRLKGRTFRVVGVLERRGAFLGMASMDNRVIIPLQAFTRLYGRRRSLKLGLTATSAELLSQAQDEATQLLRRRRGLLGSEPNSFEVSTNESMTKTFRELSTVITAATVGVCLLSLIVGGIGILNIMLFSVTERTREIGIRKALGARRRRILLQFAIEAVALSLLGGLAGVLLGATLGGLTRWVGGLLVSIPAWAVALSLGVASAVGLVFGIWPASAASRLDPVEAMRAE